MVHAEAGTTSIQDSNLCESTKATYKSHLRAYLRFCIYFECDPVPINNTNLFLYAVFLACTLKPDSVRQYLNIVRLIHLESGLSNPLEGNYALRMLLRGIQKRKGQPPRQKLPITPSILKEIVTKLDLSDSFQATFWAVCLVAFYTFCRKSTLLPKSPKNFNKTLDLCQKDICVSGNGLLITIKRTKTLRYRDRLLQIPIPKIGGPLCPVAAVENMQQQMGVTIETSPLFVYRVGTQSKIMTHKLFTGACFRALQTRSCL